MSKSTRAAVPNDRGERVPSRSTARSGRAGDAQPANPNAAGPSEVGAVGAEPSTGGSTSAVNPSDLRSRILRTATQHFAERGYGATSIREVVEAVGCTKPALYYYFPSKEALFLEALAEPLQGYADLLSMVAGTPLPFQHKVRLLVEQILHHVQADPIPMRLVMTSHLRPERGQPNFDVEAARAATELATVSLVRQGLDEGAVRSDIAPEHIARFLLGILHETAMASMQGAHLTCPAPMPSAQPYPSERMADVVIAAQGPAPAYAGAPRPSGLADASPSTTAIAHLLTDLFFHGVKP